MVFETPITFNRSSGYTPSTKIKSLQAPTYTPSTTVTPRRTVPYTPSTTVTPRSQAPSTKRADTRPLASLSTDAFDPRVSASIKVYGDLVSKEKVQQELSSMKIYMNRIFGVSSPTGAQLQTAAELALVSAWVGTGNTRKFLKALKEDGISTNADGAFVKADGTEVDLKNLLQNRAYTSHIPTSWLVKPQQALDTFREASPAIQQPTNELAPPAPEASARTPMSGEATARWQTWRDYITRRRTTRTEPPQ
ncbi:hypothetical protein J4441_03405 [Candidatus Micrarchaeota archaeon]|nr:hypothetical protein [Candidatus Micrarchaeota archaeon]